MKNRNINNNTLELIMRDVLFGMSDLARDASRGSHLDKLEITAVEKQGRKPSASARILLFPGTKKVFSRE